MNVTLIFSLAVHEAVMRDYILGLEDRATAGGDLSKVASVASFFLSRVDTAVDRLLEERIKQGQQGLAPLLGKAAVANAKVAYQAFKGTFSSERFASLRARGAREQRPLWASTGTKNPTYSDLLYVEPLIGQDTVNTMPPATITAFLQHGRADTTIEHDVTDAHTALASLADAGISMEAVTEDLLADGVKAFVDSFDKLLAGIDEKKTSLLAREHVHPGASLGGSLADVEAALADLKYRKVVKRMWRNDHTVWKPHPTEISNRLGWLSVSENMQGQVPVLESFAEEVRQTGFRIVVLLGMGGSSLGPEVLRQTFGSAPGYPEFIVLDSVVPAWVNAVTESIDPARTLFLVSSKSGTTIEPNLLYRHFKAAVEAAVGREHAGEHFVAITDPGTPLASLAEGDGFRRVFLNPPDIGGRYSVLSYFGLVPAALTGIDLDALLDRADRMREACASCVPPHENPGAWLGATMGTLARGGRDKLTLMTSPSIASFGLWVEQLIAESTGKEGRGIIPIAGEPLVDPARYGDDRLFVCMRVNDDDNPAVDAAVESIKSAGHPLMLLDMKDKLDLGAEFFRWEFATAVAGAILGINPFDQPDVQSAKDAARRMLNEYRDSGTFPHIEPAVSLSELLAEPLDGKYLAIMAYLRPTEETDAAVAELRREVTERYSIATTFGYGPRFLHSTGQLHKGGPDSGLYLQLTASHENDIPIPGELYTFGVVADAQALGDLEALQRLGRRVARSSVAPTDPGAFARLAGQLFQQ